MTYENQIIGRRLPPELLAEMHKCLPLADAINVLVNVPTRAIYLNNSPRMRRTIQRIKTSLNEYIETLVGVKRDNYRKALIFYNEIEWRPQFDALLRYGCNMTSLRQFWMRFGSIVGMPENFVEQLLLHLANSRSPKMMLHSAEMSFERVPLPMPSFLKQLFKGKQYQNNDRIVFETGELKAENGQILCIFEAELHKIIHFGEYQLRLIVVNKIDQNIWFQIIMTLDPTKKFIQRLKFRQWPLEETGKCLMGLGYWEYEFKENGNVLETQGNIMLNYSLDILLRRGTAFTKFQHFKIKENYHFYGFLQIGYVDFLINYISNTKYPQQFFESIDIHFESSLYSSFIDKIRLQNEIPKDGKFINVCGNKKLHILSTVKPAEMKELEGSSKFGGYKLEFTLANMETNGKYVFDFDVQTKRGFNRIIGMKIQKRKIDEIAESKCNGQIGKGKKRKRANEEKDEPTYSGKIMKK